MQCPVCRSAELVVFFEMAAVPVFCNVLHASEESARGTERGDIQLGACGSCGMIYNTAFDPTKVEYAEGYENSLHCSAQFRAFADELARHLGARYGLHGAEIVEIGGGRGEFLSLLCELSDSRGICFDPSVPRDEPAPDGVEIVRTPFDDRGDLRADFLCCRQVLEHIPEPRPFVRRIAGVARRSGGVGVYLEVPNALWTLRDLGIWDIIYEHCSYYAPCAMARLLELEGMAGMHIRESFGGQFLSAESPVAESVPAPELGTVEELQGLVDAFARDFASATRAWRERLDGAVRDGRRVAIWGVGSKGVTFLNTVGGEGRIAHVIDINPRKHGAFTAGTGHRIAGPESLVATSPDLVVVMNPLYVGEVRTTLSGLGVDADVEPV